MANDTHSQGTSWWPDQSNLRTLLRRLPVTLALLIALVLAGLIGGTIFHPIDSDQDLLHAVAWGVPALRQGQLWTIGTSIFFTWQPYMLLTIALAIIVFVLPLELIIGSKRTALVFLVAHIAGYVLTSILVAWPLSWLGSSWGEHLADARDVGASAGAFGCAAVLSWYLPRGWIRPVQGALLAYFIVWLLATHRIWDVEHAIAGAVGFGIGWYWTHRTAAAERPLAPSVRITRPPGY